MNILVTGGLGFIGSHTIVSLLDENNNLNNTVIIVDNLSNSSINILSNIKSLVKKPESIIFIEGDINDKLLMKDVFIKYKIESIIHFASLKSVSESIMKPLLYYSQNMNSLLNLLELMDIYECNQLIFSSSATVYGSDSKSPLKETDKIGSFITNPYGQTKYFQEQILRRAHTEQRRSDPLSLLLQQSRRFHQVASIHSLLLQRLHLTAQNQHRPSNGVLLWFLLSKMV